jgi:hypothetical protein
MKFAAKTAALRNGGRILPGLMAAAMAVAMVAGTAAVVAVTRDDG